ncbi:ABC transporter substrate-binding protein [Tsukamurella serpentis]
MPFRLPHLAAAVVAIVFVAGCAPRSPGLTDDPAAPISDRVGADTVITVADQQSLLKTMLTASGEVTRLGFSVRFAEFAGGPAILESFRAGATHVAIVADVPPIHAQIARFASPIIKAWQLDRGGVSTVARPGVPLRTVADLRGRKIGYAEGTAHQAMVLRLLRAAGLSKHDVQLVPLQLTEVGEALGAGQIDIAPLMEPISTKYRLAHPDAQALPDAVSQAAQSGLMFLYAPRAAVADPVRAAALKRLSEAVDRARRWADADKNRWITTYYAGALKIPAAVGRTAYDGQGTWHSIPLDSALVARQQDTIDTLASFDEIPGGRISAEGSVDFRFNPHSST